MESIQDLPEDSIPQKKPIDLSADPPRAPLPGLPGLGSVNPVAPPEKAHRNSAKKVCVFLNQQRSHSIPYSLPSALNIRSSNTQEAQKALLSQQTRWVRLYGGITTEIDADVWEKIKSHPDIEFLWMNGYLKEVPLPDMDRLHDFQGIRAGDVIRGIDQPQPVIATPSLGLSRQASLIYANSIPMKSL